MEPFQVELNDWGFTSPKLFIQQLELPVWDMCGLFKSDSLDCPLLIVTPGINEFSQKSSNAA